MDTRKMEIFGINFHEFEMVKILDEFGQVWVSFGRVWTSLDEFGRVWTSLDEFGRVWTSLDEFGRVWPSLAELGRAGPSWAKLGQAGPSWAELGRAGPSWAELRQAISKHFRISILEGEKDLLANNPKINQSRQYLEGDISINRNTP